MAADEELTAYLQARVGQLENHIRWLEDVCASALEANGHLSLDLAARIKAISPLRSD